MNVRIPHSDLPSPFIFINYICIGEAVLYGDVNNITRLNAYVYFTFKSPLSYRQTR